MTAVMSIPTNRMSEPMAENKFDGFEMHNIQGGEVVSAEVRAGGASITIRWPDRKFVTVIDNIQPGAIRMVRLGANQKG